MDAAQKDPIPKEGFPIEDILDAVRSEPAVAWFLAQALWVAQPVLEAFWPQEKITAVAELLESSLDRASTDGLPHKRTEGGKRM